MLECLYMCLCFVYIYTYSYHNLLLSVLRKLSVMKLFISLFQFKYK